MVKTNYCQELDPDLKLFSGPQYLNDQKINFGLFLDSSPDRWGRMLMDRREAIEARTSGKPKRRLSEVDYLLGVDDSNRMGALRYKHIENGPYLADNVINEIPPISNIRELEQASLFIEDDNFFEGRDARKWLGMLITPGSSLGGARPKASVKDTSGDLWIAKFSSKSDCKDSGAWELVVNNMAKDLGINVATGDARKFSQKYHTFLTKRFDRTNGNQRIHFASAMYLLGYKDGYSHKDGGSYFELIQIIESFGSDPDEDIRELWRRIVFSVAISNTDDHLRNHGFILTPHGWKLSPAYDINPNEQGTGLSLNISENDNSLDFELCMEVSEFYRWKKDEAAAFIQMVKNIVGQWKTRAEIVGISNSEKELMRPAFEK